MKLQEGVFVFYLGMGGYYNCFLVRLLSSIVQFMNPGHQPQRFQAFKELEDMTGFTLPDHDYIYLYDLYGGWFDQYGNYYNSYGQADEPPLGQHDSQRDQYSSHSDYREDSFQKEFGLPRDQSDDDEDNEEAVLASIALNVQNLKEYPSNKPLIVFFNNLSPRQSRQSLFSAYLQKISGLLNVKIDKESHSTGKDTGFFVVSNTLNAQQLIFLEGKKIGFQELYFEIERYQDYIVDPLKEEELTFQLDQPVKKRFVLKNPEPENEKKEESAKVQAQWKWYKFEKDIFPKKSSFKEWMIENGFNHEQDFKNVQKIQGQSKYVKISMTVMTFASINGLNFNQRKVQFLAL